MLGRSFSKDLLSGQRLKNTGQQDRYLVGCNHPAIIARELFKQVNGTTIAGS